jgi:hypothetical protein
VEKHHHEKLMGPSGSFAGTIILIAGLAALFWSWTAISLIIIGAFAAFTTTTTIIDYAGRRVRYSTTLFGMIPTGKWIAVDSSMKVRVRQSGRSYTTYSRSNRQFTMDEHDFSIMLKRPDGTEICPLRRFPTRSEAEVALESIAQQLGVEIVA